MPAVKGIGRKPKAGTVKNKLVVEGPQLRKVSIKMNILKEPTNDRSKQFKRFANAARDFKALAEELKGQLREAIADADKHQRVVKKATMNRDLAVRLVEAYMNRSQRLLDKNSKRSNAWVCKHVSQLDLLGSRAEEAEYLLDYADMQLSVAEEKVEQVLAAVKSAQGKMRARILAEKN